MIVFKENGEILPTLSLYFIDFDVISADSSFYMIDYVLFRSPMHVPYLVVEKYRILNDFVIRQAMFLIFCV